MAVCKTGHKVLYSSQLNSLAVHLSLMEKTDCKYMFSAIGVNVSDIVKDRPMDAFIVPELDNLIDLEDKVPQYPYTKKFEEAVHDPCTCPGYLDINHFHGEALTYCTKTWCFIPAAQQVIPSLLC